MRESLPQERRAAVLERVTCELQLGRPRLVGEVEQLRTQDPGHDLGDNALIKVIATNAACNSESALSQHLSGGHKRLGQRADQKQHTMGSPAASDSVKGRDQGAFDE
jgi:hypothetical protein